MDSNTTSTQSLSSELSRQQLEQQFPGRMGVRRRSFGSASSISAQNEKCRKTPSEEVQITIPIVKPPCWREVQPLVRRIPVTFDERGVKETMTVKPGRWSAFVDRQRGKLEKEVQEAKVRAANLSAEAAQAHGAGGGDAGAGAGIPDVEDVAELQQMIDSMDDWKDLARYSGKSISMASTRRGNEMKIHIVTFAERDDGQGVDFMRLSYRKSVEIRPGAASRAKQAHALSLGQVARSVLPFVPPPEGLPEAEERCVQLLQRPDVAKFTIALAFREALEDDGIHLHFSEAKFDDQLI